MTYDDVINLIDQREKDIADDAKLPSDQRKNPKASKLSKNQKDGLKELANEFLLEYRGEDDWNKRFQLFLLAASKVV